MTFTVYEIVAAFLAAYLGITSARSNIYIVLDWTSSKSGRQTGLRFLSLVDAAVLIGMTYLGYWGIILCTFFISKALYLFKVDYETTLSQ